jgi:hypothetical protein
MHKQYKQQHPEIATYEKQLEEIIAQAAKNSNIPHAGRKTTATDTTYYDVPVVVHVIHNYGSEAVSDNEIYQMMAHLNKAYSAQNSDTAAVIAPFKKYIGNTRVRFHLASKDPLGNPTKGITHTFNYLTFGGDDQAKLGQWPPASYYNIWLENHIGRGIGIGTVLAYATFPASAASNPFYDGVMSGYEYINASDNTIEHETGHYLNLLHTWNSSGANVGEACGDDAVDDTPPTKGHFSTCLLYDTVCATNYYKIYTRASGTTDSLVNYPDTTNTQNIMDYSSCTNMFTKGQAARMRATLDANIASRNNLWAEANLIATGVKNTSGSLVGRLDLKPVPDFAVKINQGNNVPFAYFAFPGTPVTFHNKSWGDTITAMKWTFGNGATPATSTGTSTVAVTFATGGWAPVTLEATGNNSGTTTATYPNTVFVANPVAKDPAGYMQDFDPAGDRDQWPTFNYYNNEFKWELANTGVYDGWSIKYKGFDDRLDPLVGKYPLTGKPKGDYDDFYTAPMDLSSFTDYCNLDFWYSGASRSSYSPDVSDTLIIQYSVNKSNTWTTLTTLSKSQLVNQGAQTTAYTPSNYTQWSPMTIPLPAAARTGYVTFRFRYMPGVSKAMFFGVTDVLSSSNNFYMDRIMFSRTPAEATNIKLGATDVAVVPNPTHGNAYVMISDVNNTSANVVVTDITGKVVFSTSAQLSSNLARVEIPQSAIAVKGVYMVQTITGSQVNTQKLVSY